ncbi:YciI family protein [Pontibacter arcticus]|uniref:YCII-related domain-containing protein n=1 Tax=Pontibacter arcticus TaxID=2080288 RepID=A0A364RHC2_9BACT|nr:YciI family protein [Pontibacter arcticus]RAU83701.1 hypothetical protein DP923_01100 [Pontibacter arcticus]
MKKLIRSVTFTAALLLCATQLAFAQATAKPAQKAPAQPAPANTEPPQQPIQTRTYYIAILKNGPYQPKDAAEEQTIQTAHMNHMRKLAETGKLAMAGQIPEKDGLHAMFIFSVASMAEAKAITDADPAIKAGRFTLELHPWIGQRGTRLP